MDERLDRDLAMRIRHVRRMAQEESRILSILIKRNFASYDTIHTILYGGRPECDQPEPKIVDVQVCKARKSMRNAGIPANVRTKWDDGYYMTREDKIAFMAALEEAEMPEAVQAAEELPPFIEACAA
jgi:hypothetical protein